MERPDRFPWKDEYSVGDQSIDAQHRTLLDLANLLHRAIQGGKGYHVIQDAYEALSLYTRQHFTEEERFWKGKKSRYFEEHRLDHAAIADELLGLRQAGPYGTVFCTPIELADWVERRLVQHILQDDRKAYAGMAEQRQAGDKRFGGAPARA